MIDHLQDRALGGSLGSRGQPEEDEAHVADRGVGHQLLDVGLDQRDQRAVDDADDCERRHQRHEGVPRVGQQSPVEAQQTVRAHLEQDTREDDRPGARRLDVSVGQPGVEREHGHLDEERQRERGEHQQRGGEDPSRRREMGRRRQEVEVVVRPGACLLAMESREIKD